MNDNQIRFDDGAAHERMMGVWSRLAGEDFLNWLTPAPGQRWIDNWQRGLHRTAGATLRAGGILGVDPSEELIAYFDPSRKCPAWTPPEAK